MRIVLCSFVSFLCLFGRISANESACSAPATLQDVLRCAQKNHPDIQRAESRIANLDAYLRLARQRPNPELDVESTFRDENDEPSTEIEATYLHTFELGGKRKARISQAKMQQDLLRAQVLRMKEEVTLKTVLNLYRLRQLESELATVDESLEVFRKIAGQYKSRRHLAPEQEVSLSVFSLAEGDYQLKRSLLLQEQQALNGFFELALGTAIQLDQLSLPEKPASWPVVNLQPASFREFGSIQKEAQATAALAKAGYKVARSEIYPNLALGPRMVLESGNGQNSEAYGAALSLGLPLYHRNKGLIALAKNDFNQAQISLEQTNRELETQRKILLNTYRMSLDALAKSPDYVQMQKKHHNVEGLFDRGVVSASLIIEAHRQMTEFVTDQNEQELRAIEALWMIYALDGRIMEEKL